MTDHADPINGPSEAEKLYEEAQALMNAGRLEEAKTAYERLIEAFGEEERRLDLAVCCLLQAYEAAGEWLQQEPRNPAPLREMQRLQQALRLLRSLFPDGTDKEVLPT